MGGCRDDLVACWMCGDETGPEGVDARRRCIDRKVCDERAARLAMFARIFGVNGPLRSPRRGYR